MMRLFCQRLHPQATDVEKMVGWCMGSPLTFDSAIPDLKRDVTKHVVRCRSETKRLKTKRLADKVFRDVAWYHFRQALPTRSTPITALPIIGSDSHVRRTWECSAKSQILFGIITPFRRCEMSSLSIKTEVGTIGHISKTSLSVQRPLGRC